MVNRHDSVTRRRLSEESSLAKTRRARRIGRELARLYPDAHCELYHNNPFQLLVATVLSAQTTDVQVNRCTPALFAAYPNARALAEAELADVEELIRPTGFYRSKARSIVALAQQLLETHDGQVPARLNELVKLKGVGRKTANVVLGNAFGIPGLTIDTHFGRIARRLNWSSSDKPEQVEQDVAKLFERRDYTILSHRVIFHGRRTCHGKRPACGVCTIARDCPSYGIGETNPELAQDLLKPATAAQTQALAYGIDVPQPSQSRPKGTP